MNEAQSYGAANSPKITKSLIINCSMQSFSPLIYQYQPYDWGKIGADSLVYNLANKAGLVNEDKLDKPFAELWMGAHPPIPSSLKEANGNQTNLNDLISQEPEKFLGKAYAQFGKNKLPFLFKVLSVRKTLSLQVHPDKEFAKELNQKNPEAYKDDNHKPEMALAVSEFHAMCNFRPYEEIVEALNDVQAFREVVGEEAVEAFKTCTVEERPKKLRDIMAGFFKIESEAVKKAVSKLIAEISSKKEQTLRDKLVLKLQDEFPNDIGIFISYLLNYIVAKPGEAFVMDPNEPHAYVFGNCLEVMAASDNVIRGCLTPKFVDKETLLQALSYKMKNTKVFTGDQIFTHEKDGYELVHYPTHYEEFCCTKVEINQKNVETKNIAQPYPSIGIVLKGSGTVLVQGKDENEYKEQQVKEGESVFFFPDSQIKFKTGDDSLVVYLSTCQSL